MLQVLISPFSSTSNECRGYETYFSNPVSILLPLQEEYLLFVFKTPWSSSGSLYGTLSTPSRLCFPSGVNGLTLRLSPYDRERGTTVGLLVDVAGGFGYTFFVFA